MSVSSRPQAPRHPEPAANEAESTAIAAEIADLLGRAVRHGQPLFLIAIYEHEGDKLRLLEVLRRRLLEEGYTTQTLDPRHRPDHGLGRFYAALAECGPRALSLVSDLPRKTGGAALEPAFLEYFNLHRDRIARDRLRFLVFLHVVEMEGFVRLAGDMWDFRHRTYWLERPADPRGEGLWQTMAERGAALPLPAAERESIDRHLAGVRAVVDGAADHETKAGLLLDLCRFLTRRNAAGLAAEAALEGLSELGDARTDLRADLEGELGDALHKSSQLPEALHHYEQSLAVCREIGDRAGEAVMLNNISQIYHDWGQYEEALKLLKQSLAIRHEIGDRGGEAVTLNNISQIYHAWGRYEETLKTLEQSLAIKREIGNRAGEAGTLSNISQIYHARGRNEEALKFLEQSRAIYWEIGDRKGGAVTLNNISQIYHDWGRNEEALKLLEQSLAIYREIGDRAGEAMALNNISKIYDAWGRYQEALKTLERSLAIFREIGDRVGEALTSWNLGLAYEHHGDLTRALPLLENSVRIEEALKHPDLERDQAYLAALKNRMREPGAEPSSSGVEPMIPRSDPK
ncbi:MAG: tetratricopeptide repeat protein [Gammaproteobacteria bacterium]